MSRSSNFLLAGFSKKKSNSVARKKTKDSSESSLVTPLGSGGDTANPGDANVSGHLCGQGKPMRMVEGAMLSPLGTVPGNPEVSTLGGTGLSSAPPSIVPSGLLFGRCTNPSTDIRVATVDPDLNRSPTGSSVPLSALPVPNFGPDTRAAESDPGASTNRASPSVRVPFSRFGLRGAPTVGLLSDTRPVSSSAVSVTATSRKRRGIRDAVAGSSSDFVYPSKKPRSDVTEPFAAPRGPPLVATLPPSVPPPPPEFSDWMRAFADALCSSMPESAPPVLPTSVSDPIAVDLISELSEDASISPEQSPVRVSSCRIPPGSSLFASPPHASLGAPIGGDRPCLSGQDGGARLIVGTLVPSLSRLVQLRGMMRLLRLCLWRRNR
ncbi:verprolin-like [Strongylocentrotus purpuratus]|uniref:Uncharacterized protein n=1 Tax=Strongylocentrotus purpuratus TaxID=7668 RepID=A0A7M7SVR8_STRPU|nr:verprolin-like [Strongylocentrotus purpuratus]